MPRSPALLLSLGAVLLASGCGDPKYKWTTELLDEELDRVASLLPMCEAVERGQAISRPMPSRARTDGPCGGSIEGTSEHDNGITDFELLLSGFCAQGSAGSVVLDGVIKAREVGKPGNTGPVVNALEVETDGPLTADQSGDVSSWEVVKLKVEYGQPQEGSPGVPDEANPDRISVEEFSATYADGTVSYMRNVEMTRVGPFTAATLEITNGITGTEGIGRADMRTDEADPLIFDIGSLGFTSGLAQFEGKGSSLSVIPNPQSPGVIDLELDGVPHSRSLDCSAAADPLLDIGFALLLELPVY